MKKLLCLFILFVCVACATSCSSNTLVVYTESGFAPFEYVQNGEITGVDVDIMKLVAEKLGKKLKFENVAFNTIVDAVKQGKLTNVGAAGLSITEDRLEKVDFSTVYYTANLYVIYNVENAPTINTMTDGKEGVYWQNINSTKGVGIQDGTTADLFISHELEENGLLYGTNKTSYDSLQVAVADIGLNIDYVVIDELPAKQLIKGDSKLACAPLYYQGEEGEPDEVAFDQYAICVTKGKTEILNAINEVLAELLVEDKNGVNGIQKLVNKHLGIEE